MRVLRGTPAELHAREIDWSTPSVTLCEATSTAVVLGSTQRHPDTAPGGVGVPASARSPGLRGARAGVDIVRRRSGGGAVWVAPGDPLWVDVVVPRDDRRWVDDVGRAFYWLGEAWAEAIGGDAVVHRGALCTTQWSRQVCFAGLGPGEVSVGGRKVVGIAQRRTRFGALFQCAVHRTWDPAPLAARLGLPPAAAMHLADVAVGIDVTAVVRRLFVSQ